MWKAFEHSLPQYTHIALTAASVRARREFRNIVLLGVLYKVRCWEGPIEKNVFLDLA